MPRGLTRPSAALAALALAAVPAAAQARPGVRATAPSGLVAAATDAGLALFWNGHGASSFRVQQATSSAMTSGLTTYIVHNGYTQFSPYRIAPGPTYYFRVGTGGAYSGVVSAAPVTSLQEMRVMTYNILETTADGGQEGGRTIAPWSKRRPKAAALIEQQKPDAVAVEEGAAWVGPVADHVRQIDSLDSALGSPYKVAPTEVVYPQRHWFRTGDYILYNSSTYALGQRRGHFSIGDNKWAAYQVLINRSTGARVLFIATHLIPGDGTALEATRQTETTTLFTKGHNLSESFGYPVVYAGDLNAATDTDPHFTYDSTFKPATDFGNDDAFFIAQARYNASYDSANLYKHFPPRSNDRIDRIFTAPGVGVARAGITLHLTNGQIAGVIPSDHNPVWADVYYPYAG